MSPSLTTIPPEVHSLIGRYLCTRDVNSVSRTCKTLDEAFLASLYDSVVIKVPIQWSRLASLENLISSAGSGLKFTTSICIAIQQQPSKDSTKDNVNERTTSEELASLYRLPQASFSKALNVMIRLLLRRIPDNQLKHFIHRHICSLEVSTLALLFKHQSAALRELNIPQYEEPQSISGLMVEGLQSLVISDLNIDQNCEWPYGIIMQNRNTLKNLGLGVLSKIARCSIQDRLNHKLPISFAGTAKETLLASEPEMEMLSLKSLELSGLNIADIVGRGVLGFQIDIKILTALELKSCSGLNEALTVLVGRDASTLSAFKLASFSLRHEEENPAFAQNLTVFLTSFTGLKHLRLLIEGQRRALNKGPILEMHGKTLQTLVWDERSGPRKGTNTDTALFLNSNNLNLVSQKCPELTALGLCIRWGPPASCKSATAYPQNLERISRRLPNLRTLHLRNLPTTNLTETYLPVDYLVRGTACKVLDRYADSKSLNRQKSLVTIALGASLYQDTVIGSNHFSSDPVHDYLQLRVYHVDFNYQSVLGPLPTVTQVAKGFIDAATMCSDKELLRQCWLA